METTTTKYQLAVFPKGVHYDESNEIKSELIKHLPETSQFSVLPIPSDAPRGIPRVLITYKKDEYKIEIRISFEKIDFFWNTYDVKSNIDIPKKEIIEFAGKVLSNLSQVNQIKRFGFIKTFHIESDDVKEYFLNNFLKEQVANKSNKELTNIILALTYEDELLNTDSNHLIKIDQATLPPENTRKVVRFMSDINTKITENKSFKKTKSKDFINEAFEKSQDNSRLISEIVG